MKKIISMLVLLALSSALFATPDPTTTLTSDALGYPYISSFKVHVMFSEPVTGFGKKSINIVNATIDYIIKNTNSDYTVSFTPTIAGPMSIFVPANVVKSLSTGAPNQASNKLNIMALDPILNPSSNFDLSPWALILPLPLGGIENAETISNNTLVGVPFLNTGYTNPPYFYTDNVTGTMNFFAPLNGGTTPGSVAPRSQLTELLPGDPKTWTLNRFETNVLTGSLFITQVPPLKKIVIATIHNKGTPDASGLLVPNKALVKLYYDLNLLDPNGKVCNGCLYIRIRAVPAQEKYLKTVTLLNNTPLHKSFIFKIKLLRDGTLTVKVNNKSTTYNLSTSPDNFVGWGTQELFFQAGVYLPENGSSNSLGGAAHFYSLKVDHTGCPIP